MPDPIEQAPGSTFRFKVGSAETGFGSSWSLSTHKATGDVYLAHREGGQWIKSSFHHSGQSHFAVAGQAGKTYEAVNHEQTHLAPGWTHVWRLVVARSELRNVPERVKNRPMIQVAVPPGWNGVCIDLWLGEPEASLRVDAHPDVQLVAQLPRGDGGFAVLVAIPFDVSQPIQERFADEIAEVRAYLVQVGFEDSTRIVIFGSDEDGFQVEYEVAIDV